MCVDRWSTELQDQTGEWKEGQTILTRTGPLREIMTLPSSTRNGLSSDLSDIVLECLLCVWFCFVFAFVGKKRYRER